MTSAPLEKRPRLTLDRKGEQDGGGRADDTGCCSCCYGGSSHRSLVRPHFFATQQAPPKPAQPGRRSPRPLAAITRSFFRFARSLRPKVTSIDEGRSHHRSGVSAVPTHADSTQDGSQPLATPPQGPHRSNSFSIPLSISLSSLDERVADSPTALSRPFVPFAPRACLRSAVVAAPVNSRLTCGGSWNESVRTDDAADSRLIRWIAGLHTTADGRSHARRASLHRHR